MNALKFDGRGNILKEQIDIPALMNKDEVLLKIVSSGVCHSDVHLKDNSLDFGFPISFSDNGVHFPIIGGHEIFGEVQKIGVAVKGVEVGDHCIVFPFISCKKCSQCQKGFETACSSKKELGFHFNGGFAEYFLSPTSEIIVPIKLPNVHQRKDLALLGCAGLTAYNAIINVPVGAESVLVIGCGGLGMMAIKLLKALRPSANIIAYDTNQEKLELCRKIFSVDTLQIEQQTEVDCAIDFYGGKSSFEKAIQSLKPKGLLLFIGLRGGIASITLPLLVIKQITIKGLYTGSLSQFKDLLALVSSKNLSFSEIVGKEISLTSLDSEMQNLSKGQTFGRSIISMI